MIDPTKVMNPISFATMLALELDITTMEAHEHPICQAYLNTWAYALKLTMEKEDKENDDANLPEM